jgi:predicted MFS family arabinose efflux permease
MSLCVFALVASEFMPVRLLTPIANDLRITEGMAGQGIAISGAFAVMTSLSISALAGTVDRKKLLLLLTVLMGISGAVVAVASNYLTYMAGRTLIGVVIGGFWSMSAAMAIRLVPGSQVPKALAIFNGGNALATVIAAPLIWSAHHHPDPHVDDCHGVDTAWRLGRFGCRAAGHLGTDGNRNARGLVELDRGGHAT